MALSGFGQEEAKKAMQEIAASSSTPMPATRLIAGVFALGLLGMDRSGVPGWPAMRDRRWLRSGELGIEIETMEEPTVREKQEQANSSDDARLILSSRRDGLRLGAIVRLASRGWLGYIFGSLEMSLVGW